jgi:hypothetical protein
MIIRIVRMRVTLLEMLDQMNVERGTLGWPSMGGVALNIVTLHRAVASLSTLGRGVQWSCDNYHKSALHGYN